jgi:hypothetical protein
MRNKDKLLFLYEKDSDAIKDNKMMVKTLYLLPDPVICDPVIWRK